MHYNGKAKKRMKNEYDYLANVIGRLFPIHYRLRSGSCKWKCYSIKGIGYHIAIPITKWVFKFEKPTMWVYFAKNAL
jgi:hypothetical protein